MFRLARIDFVSGGLALEELQEGTIVVAAPHSQSYDFGSREDLPGYRKPTAASELVAGAVYFAGHRILEGDYRMPLYDPYPEVDWALRKGFDRPDNTPFTAKVHLTPPSVTEGQPIPASGLMLAYRGMAELDATNFTSTAGVGTGTLLTVETTGANAGKLKAAASGDPVVAKVYAVEDSTYLVELL